MQDKIIKIYNKHSKIFFYLSFFLIFIYQFLWIPNEATLTDEFWLDYFYQQIFSHPDSVEYQFMYWLTGIVGGLWYKIFPYKGIFSLRLLGVVNYTFIYILVYTLLKDFFKREHIILIIIILVLNQNNMFTFGYNELTILLLLLFLVFLINGLRSSNYILIIISGFLLTLNIFVRLPNILFLLMYFLIPLYSILIKEGKKNIFIKTILFFLGCIIGCLIIYGILYFLGHLSYLSNSINIIKRMSNSTESSHGIFNMAAKYISNYYYVMMAGLFFSFTFILVLFLNTIHLKSLFLKRVIFLFSGLFITILIIKYFWSHRIYIEYFVSIIIILLYLISLFKNRINSNNKNNILIILLVSSFMILCILPLGSDYGIMNVGTKSVILSFSISLCLLFNIIHEKMIINIRNDSYNINVTNIVPSFTFYIFIICFGIAYLYIALVPFVDIANRSLYKRELINSEYGKLVYFDEKEGKEINELLQELKKYANEGDYLLCYDSMPLIYFLTNTKPYLYSSWLSFFTKDDINYFIKRAEFERNIVPVVVIQKEKVLGNEQKKSVFIKYKDINILKENDANLIIYNFLSGYDYKVMWQNDAFLILSFFNE